MPRLPGKVCARAGCGAVGAGRFCPKHAEEHKRLNPGWRSTTKTPTERGYGAVWRKRRKRILARDPFCKLCGRRPSKAVDHIKPKQEGGNDSDQNLRGICTPCHESKSGREGGRAAAERRRKTKRD